MKRMKLYATSWDPLQLRCVAMNHLRCSHASTEGALLWGCSPLKKEHVDFGGGVRQACAWTVQEGCSANLRAPHTAAKPSIRETPGKKIKYCMHRLSAERWDESCYYPWLRTVDDRLASCCLSYRISDLYETDDCSVDLRETVSMASSHINYQQLFTSKSVEHGTCT